MNSLKLLTLNIGEHNYLPGVIEYLEINRPDVACLQEVYEQDLALFGHIFGTYHYVPMTLKKGRSIGFAIFLSHNVISINATAEQYASARSPLCELDERTLQSRRRTERRALLVCDIEKNSVSYRIATTHFTWCKKGKPNQYQRRDLQVLLELIRGFGDVVLCGDFNSPRGGKIFDTLSEVLQDNIPERCVSTLDPELHSAVGVRVVVDGIFTSSAYRTEGFNICYGLSDHVALSTSLIKVT